MAKRYEERYEVRHDKHLLAVYDAAAKDVMAKYPVIDAGNAAEVHKYASERVDYHMKHMAWKVK